MPSVACPDVQQGTLQVKLGGSIGYQEDAFFFFKYIFFRTSLLETTKTGKVRWNPQNGGLFGSDDFP